MNRKANSPGFPTPQKKKKQMEESKKCPILGHSKKFKNYGIYQNPMPILSQIPNVLRFLIYMINVI